MEISEISNDPREKKVCAVCGDNALCFNFNAVTCESCKAFFRRNASKSKSFNCAFKNACEVTRVTRRFCQSCRLTKCFSVGMKREMILSDSEKELKRRKSDVKREMSKKISVQTAPNLPFIPIKDLEESKTQENNQPVLVLSVNEPSKACVSTQTNFNVVDSAVQTDPWHCECPLSPDISPDSSLRTAVQKLGPDQGKLLENLISSTEALEAPVDQELAAISRDDLVGWDRGGNGNGSSLLNVINLTAVAIRRLIKMCKRLKGFKSLTQADQVALLKQGVTRMMLLRSVLTYEPHNDTWKMPGSENKAPRIELEVLKEAPGNLYEAHKKFLRAFDPRAASDRLLIPILTAIALFDPAQAPKLQDSAVIALIQDQYIELLRHYLESAYSPSDANDIFCNLLERMGDLHRLHEEHIRVYLDVNPLKVEPLLREIFDLKPH